MPVQPPGVPHSAAAAVSASEQHQPEVRLVATDVDGTLLSSDQQLLPRVQSAVQRSVELGVPVRPLVFCTPDSHLTFSHHLSERPCAF